MNPEDEEDRGADFDPNVCPDCGEEISCVGDILGNICWCPGCGWTEEDDDLAPAAAPTAPAARMREEDEE